MNTCTECGKTFSEADRVPGEQMDWMIVPKSMCESERADRIEYHCPHCNAIIGADWVCREGEPEE